MNIETACYGYTGTLSKELVDFARRQLVNATLYKGDERRLEDRHPMLLPVLAVPVDQDNQPIGEPLEVVTRDVSASAIGLFHAEQLRYERYAIHLSLANTNVDLVIELLWKNPMGPFYGSAGKYCDKLDCFPVALPCLED